MSTDDYDLTIQTGYNTPGRRRNNWLASNIPTVFDSSNYRWEIGSHWVFGSNVWLATDVTPGAAEWVQLDGVSVGGGDGDLTSLYIDTSIGGLYTVDRDLAATHDLTLTSNAVLSFSGARTGEATDWRLLLRQDGTGNRLVTWADTITWVGGMAPTLQTGANAVDTIGILTVDDGDSYFGFHASGSGAITGIEVAETDLAPDVSDVTRIEFDGATVTDDGGGQVTVTITASSSLTNAVGPILIADDHSTPIVFGDFLLTEEEDDLLYADP